MDKILKILLIEDNIGDVRLLREYLSESSEIHFELRHSERLTEALQCINNEHFDLILLDMMLPDSQGFDTFIKIKEHAFDIPIVVLSGLYYDSMALKAVAEGAQDYLVKGEVDARLLIRAMRYAIERHRMQMALRSQSLIDDLTGLYNRRGFLTLAEQQIKLSRRSKRGFFLVFVDLDGLKQINDSFGHLQGDAALIKTAGILKRTFRETDILSRIGGDEFMALAIDATGDSSEVITKRIEEIAGEFNNEKGCLYKLSLSYGIAYFDSTSDFSIEELMNKTDEELYRHKRSKRQT